MTYVSVDLNGSSWEFCQSLSFHIQWEFLNSARIENRNKCRTNALKSGNSIGSHLQIIYIQIIQWSAYASLDYWIPSYILTHLFISISSSSTFLLFAGVVIFVCVFFSHFLLNKTFYIVPFYYLPLIHWPHFPNIYIYAY